MSEHPRDRFDLIPSPEAETAFVDAMDRGRLHHAWLVCGPEGLGKATFAYRAARRLLGAAALMTLSLVVPGCSTLKYLGQQAAADEVFLAPRHQRHDQKLGAFADALHL